MKIEWNRKYNTIAVYAFLVVVASIVFLAGVLNFQWLMGMTMKIINLLMPFIYGFVMAYILNPVLHFIESKIFPPLFGDRGSYKLRRALSIFLTYLFAFFTIGVFFSSVIPQIVESVYNLASRIPSYLGSIEGIIRQIVAETNSVDLPSDVVDSLVISFEDALKSLYAVLRATLPVLMDFTVKFSAGVLNWVLGLIISVYMFMGKERFFAQAKKLLYALFEKDTVDEILRQTRDSHAIFSGFITGKILDSLIIGLICFACLSVFRMPYAMLISVIVGVTNVIPYFGPFIGAIPSVFIMLTVSPIKALFLALFILVLQQFDGNILGPKILGQSTGLSAFWVVFSIMLFGGLFGFVGMFIGVPTFAVIYSNIRAFAERRLRRKNLPLATRDYAVDAHDLVD